MVRLFYRTVHISVRVICVNKLKIAVYAIAKNEEKFVDRWVDSMQEADEIYVTDTGSTDNTVEKLKQWGVIVNSISLEAWRFDKARNISLDFVAEDVDVCVCTDLDEVFEKGWRDEIEKIWLKGVTTRMRYKYIWSFKENGTPETTFYIEKIHSRFGFRWIHPVHEVLEYFGDAPDVYAENDNIVLKHYPDTNKSREQYLPLLELSVRESPDDDRNVHYLGREYMFYERWDDCIRTLKHHLEMPSARWADERCASMRYISRAYYNKGDFTQASNWLYRAIAEAPYLREPYVEMMHLAYVQGDYFKAYFMSEQALKITSHAMTYINEGYCWDYTLYDIAAVSAYNIGLYDRALTLAQTAYKMNPADERLKSNAALIKQLERFVSDNN